MQTSRPAEPSGAVPPPLTVAASLAALEGLLVSVLGVLEVSNLTSARATMGLTTSVFFIVYGVVLVLCAWQVRRLHSWARSPLVLAQLIQILVGWDFRGGSTTWVAVASILVSLVVLVGLLVPASIQALSDRPED